MQPVQTHDAQHAPGPSLASKPNPLTGTLGWRWPLIGMASTLAMALAAPSLIMANDGPATKWWYVFRIPPNGGHLGNLVIFYVGMITLSVSWLALGRRLRGVSPRSICVVAVMWVLPLVLGPPMFSRDIYSYAGQGLLPTVGLNPYVYGPGVLGVWGHPGLASAVAPVWRFTVSPYGPTFITLASLVTGGASSLVGAVIDLRLLEVVGVGLIALYVPRLARLLGSDSGRAAWLAVLSPLVLLSLVAAGHNDALMAGLLVAGVTLSMERRPLLGIVLCAVAATIKLPAAAGVVFIAVAWAREQAAPASKAKVLVAGGAAMAAVFVGVTVATGLGWGWLSFSALSTPGQVVVTVTPSTALGIAAASLLHALDIGPPHIFVVSAFRIAGLGLAGVAGIYLLWRTRRDNLVLCLGLTLLAVVVVGPITWPWYLTWSITLLAAWPATQRSWVLVATLAGFGFVLGPAGSSLFSAPAAPYLAVGLLVAGFWAWKSWRGPLLEELDIPKMAKSPWDVGSWDIAQIASRPQRSDETHDVLAPD